MPGRLQSLVCLIVLLIAAIVSGQDEVYVVNGTALPGSTVDVVVRGISSESLGGFVVVSTYPNNELEYAFASPAGDFVGEVAVEIVQIFVNPSETPTTGVVSVATIFDAFWPFAGQSLPAGSDREFVRITFEVTGAPGSCAEIVLADGLGTPPLNNVLLRVSGSPPPLRSQPASSASPNRTSAVAI